MKNLSIKTKLAMFPIILFIILGAIFGTYKIKTDDMTEIIGIHMKLNQELQSYQYVRILIYQQLRGADKIKDVNDNIESHKKGFSEIANLLKLPENKSKMNDCSKFIDEYDFLWKEYLKMANEQKNGSTNITDEKINSHITKLASVGAKIQSNLEDVVKSATKLREELMSSVANLIMVSFILAFIAFLIFSLVVMKQITSSLSSIQQGLNSFFSFLNRESLKADLINLDSKDEFGQMAIVINDNIERVKKGIDEDRRLIDETITVLGEFEQGDLCQRLELSVSNPALMQLKTVLNNMASNLENNIDNVLKVLEEYSHYNYLNKVDEKGLKEHILKLATGVNTLGSAVTNMLSTSLQNGIDLQGEASTLKQAVESLSTASNQQAASLEETAAAMEEMTSNVQNNVAKSNDMALMATQTDSAAKDGAVLASRTASAMTEIQSATNSINDAVAIIENIAFQTNILSLNAAVEAATAGDAGKGFAVVAQEVRNLANRSADAAKEIKAMASQAAHKSNEGMNIATELTRGFEVIADKIAQTASMVQDVSNANREQMQGIGQINTAVTQLDQMTQENAKVAAQADAIANATISKAEAMVQDAQSKEFVGKNNIRATATRTNAKPVQAAKPVVVKQKYASNAIAKNSSKHESDVWESF
ncbi:MAG: methyl-accepting chemotaxis protein [Sulfurimonas sp.]|nr:methyl-accepting chemotaxis protein [Sulfurimonas sp.]